MGDRKRQEIEASKKQEAGFGHDLSITVKKRAANVRRRALTCHLLGGLEAFAPL
jgi:hypothetical protein